MGSLKPLVTIKKEQLAHDEPWAPVHCRVLLAASVAHQSKNVTALPAQFHARVPTGTLPDSKRQLASQRTPTTTTAGSIWQYKGNTAAAVKVAEKNTDTSVGSHEVVLAGLHLNGCIKCCRTDRMHSKRAPCPLSCPWVCPGPVKRDSSTQNSLSA